MSFGRLRNFFVPKVFQRVLYSYPSVRLDETGGARGYFQG